MFDGEGKGPSEELENGKRLRRKKTISEDVLERGGNLSFAWGYASP